MEGLRPSSFRNRPAESALIDWGRRLLSTNPFYLASAGLLLYGVNRLSSDPRLAGAESSQLTFNFCALFSYEILLVITAIVLARRLIWYDALLLVGLENVFVLIPFSLVSRAVFLKGSLSLMMCSGAVLFAVAKFWALKHCLPELNLSRRWMFFGVVIMAANVGIALAFHRLEHNRAALTTLLNLNWLIALPLLVGLANFLPKRSASDKPIPQLSWLLQAIPVVWITVTALHLGGVGFVYGFQWQLALLAPVLWVLAWTLRHRITDFVAAPSPSLLRQLLCGPFLATLFAVGDHRLFPALNLLSAGAFVCIYTGAHK